MSDSSPSPNTLYGGDCLKVLSGWPSEIVDLCYLDPPFNSKTDHKTLFSTGEDTSRTSQKVAFEDTWCWDDDAADRVGSILSADDPPCLASCVDGLRQILGPTGMLSYLSYMAERLPEIRRVLKPTGSIYLHCDPTASHYLKVLMDNIFGAQNFRNEIVWRVVCVSGYKTRKRGWIRNHDCLLYYTISEEAAQNFNKEYLPYPPAYVPRDGERPTGKGIPVEDTWNCSSGDVLDSIMVKSFSREKVGYPTQKPVGLLRRIIKASSNPGEVVLDPFCGSGSTLAAADELGRDWIGIDISLIALAVADTRLRNNTTPMSCDIPEDRLDTMVQAAISRTFVGRNRRIPGLVVDN